MPTDFVWEEGIIAGLSLPLCGISGSPVAQLEVLCGSNPQATPCPESPDISIASVLISCNLQVSPTLPRSVKGADGTRWNQL